MILGANRYTFSFTPSSPSSSGVTDLLRLGVSIEPFLVGDASPPSDWAASAAFCLLVRALISEECCKIKECRVCFRHLLKGCVGERSRRGDSDEAVKRGETSYPRASTAGESRLGGQIISNQGAPKRRRD